MATKKNDGDFWKNVINSITAPFPEVGSAPPVEETIKDAKAFNGIDPNSVGNFSRITLDIYFFMDTKSNKYFMMQSQKMVDLGEMTLGEAAEIVKRRQRRK